MEERQASQLTTGLVVMAVGLILLASQFDSGWALDFGRLWPMVFVFIGIGRVLTRSWGSAVWFLFLGGIFLLHTYGIVRLNQSWPMFIVFGGICIMFPRDRSGWREARRRIRRNRHGESEDGSVQS
jgi:hypothetical protein